ncbi:hypothetical protein RJ55_02239 [Drechmeria coniospora]|nr:hypothetical protein RJ55_02239 [Drechmeria coniospora]
MSGIARKIIVCAALDGLIIQPLSSKGQRSFQPVRVKYGESSVSAVPREQVPDTTKAETSFEAFGVIGLITVSRQSYLVTITRRKQVGQILGFPIYSVTDVALTPCTSKADAEEAIGRTASLLRSDAATTSSADAESTDDEAEFLDSVPDELEDVVPSEGDASPDPARSSVVDDVLRLKGSYGRFAQSWFSNRGWAMDQRRTMGISVSATNQDAASATTTKPVQDAHDPIPVSSLLPKLLRTAKVLFGSSRSFYFSYDVDITRNLAQGGLLSTSTAPLHTQSDKDFFWNRHILQPFVEMGQESLALPLMQGFVGQREFVADSHPPKKAEMGNLAASTEVPSPPSSGKARASTEVRQSEKTFLLTLISRRSTQRAGLRYLRRGVNEDGFTANMVETEQILSSPAWDAGLPIRSFLQIRGSIPLFFSQSAYALKPAPLIQHSQDANYSACKLHLERLEKSYGALQIVNLVEKQGIEEPLGTQYQKNIERFNAEANDGHKIPFEWFDFHRECRGMKFENVSHLLLKLQRGLEEMGSTTYENGELSQRQKAVLRTNCMDCLDRTNVCQSSFAKHMLERQLQDVGIDLNAQLDQETAWFNMLWADNGDAVSKQYASTAAMKGDYTRTKKRDYRGALNDLGLSLARFYNGMVNDYFSQAAIDFLLGNVTAKVFEEFESDMMTKDPAVSISNIRERAVKLCQNRVVADPDEEVQGGWVLISPSAADVVKSWPMDEVVLLLTSAALYLCRFDWDLDKVSYFERVHLGNVTHIKVGTYITSTISASHMDETRNVGFVVEYQPGKSNIRRTNTRTLSTLGSIAPNRSSGNRNGANLPVGFTSFFSSKPKSGALRKLAFKAPYADSSSTTSSKPSQQTELQQVEMICTEIGRLASNLQQDEEYAKKIIEKGDIISLQEAKRNTGLLEQLGHSIKKLVWA